MKGNWRTNGKLGPVSHFVSAILVTVISTSANCALSQAAADLIEMQFAPTSVGAPIIENGIGQKGVDWPSTLKFFDPNKKDFVCTATMVGARVIVTAGHCLPADTAAAFVNLDGQIKANLICKRDPSFNEGNLYSDVALCLSDIDFRRNNPYESLDLRDGLVSHGSDLFLLGFGCRDVNDPMNKDLVGVLYGGVAKVSTLPGDPPGVDIEHIRTGGHPSDVVICPGDSGGAAYLLSNIAHLNGPRSVIGVNSGNFAAIKASAITSLSAKGPAKFITEWAKDNKVAICGLDATAKQCKNRYSP